MRQTISFFYPKMLFKVKFSHLFLKPISTEKALKTIVSKAFSVEIMDELKVENHKRDFRPLSIFHFSWLKFVLKSSLSFAKTPRQRGYLHL